MSVPQAPILASTKTGDEKQIIDSPMWRQWFDQLVREVNNSLATTTVYREEFDYDASGNLIYFGKAAPGTANSSALWQIRQINYNANSNVSEILFANGSDSFTNIWNNRANLSYS